ncbi:MAG: hypothetical protein V1767_01135 [Chloroflexota bacterium]
MKNTILKAKNLGYPPEHAVLLGEIEDLIIKASYLGVISDEDARQCLNDFSEMVKKQREALCKKK